MNPAAFTYPYRGYRYDTETGLYYLQSRYYNPEWGSFINADAIVAEAGTLLGSNMFAYCFNNPVNMSDDEGTWPTWNDIKNGLKKVFNAYLDWRTPETQIITLKDGTKIETLTADISISYSLTALAL